MSGTLFLIWLGGALAMTMVAAILKPDADDHIEAVLSIVLWPIALPYMMLDGSDDLGLPQ